MTTHVEYMLVLQWPSCGTTDELDLLVSIEEEIRENLGDLGNVDGHDIGSGEMNIFIFTEDPLKTFQKVVRIGAVSRHLSNLKAGYRKVGEDDFVPLCPEGLDYFSVV